MLDVLVSSSQEVVVYAI